LETRSLCRSLRYKAEREKAEGRKQKSRKQKARKENAESGVPENNPSAFCFLPSANKPYRRYIVQLFLGLVLGALLQLIFPFLTQGIVDYGVSN